MTGTLGGPHPLRSSCKAVLAKIRVGSVDAIHAATMVNNGIQEIYSTDPHFDHLPEIRRIPPK